MVMHFSLALTRLAQGNEGGSGRDAVLSIQLLLAQLRQCCCGGV